MANRRAPDVCVATHRTDPDRTRPAADGLRLCPGCRGGLERNITELPGRHADVEDQLSNSGTSTGPAVSGSPSSPLPFNPAAAALLSQIHHDLAWVTHLVLDERGLVGPGPSVAAMCAWLGRHVDWLAAHPDAGVFRDVFAELAGRAMGVIDPRRQPLHIGPCIEQVPAVVAGSTQPCDGHLYATIARDGDPASTMWCDTCTLTLTTAQWHRYGKRYQAAQRERITS